MSCQRFDFNVWGPAEAKIREEKQTVFPDLHRQLSDHVNTLKVHSYQDQSQIRLYNSPHKFPKVELLSSRQGLRLHQPNSEREQIKY